MRCSIPELMSLLVALFVIVMLLLSRVKQSQSPADGSIRLSSQNVRKSNRKVPFARRKEPRRKVANAPPVAPGTRGG